MVTTLVLLVVGRLVAAVYTQQGVGEALLNVGVPAVLAAAAGGLRVLLDKAETLQRVTAIHKGDVVSAGNHLGVRDLSQMGDRLAVDGIYVYVVFAIVMAIVLFESRVGAPHRAQAPIGPLGWTRYVVLGFLVPAFFGVSALYAVYARS